ncbi:TniQ family protein [Variovorax sp. GB1R11]|uniref:TniQ family protein n=1 Tax=Variovorax sp. GB1R11 TaxID=3443741 RepID=UPI003F465F49
MLDIPSLLPGEFAYGYLNTIFRFHGIRPQKCDISEMQRRWGTGDGDPAKTLASLGFLAPPDLLRRHTLQYFLSRATETKDSQISAITDTKYDFSYLLHRARNDTFFCSSCIDDDIDRFGRSYWHVAHQLPGIYECPMHPGTTLSSSWRSEIFWLPPGHAQDSTYKNSEWSTWLENRTVRRYTAIALYMSNWEGDLNRYDLVDCFQRRARILNLDGNNLATYLTRRFPHDWLRQVASFTRMTATRPPQCFLSLTRTDRLAPIPRRMFACLAAAALWPSASEAIAAMTALDAAPRDGEQLRNCTSRESCAIAGKSSLVGS